MIMHDIFKVQNLKNLILLRNRNEKLMSLQEDLRPHFLFGLATL